MGRVFLAVWVVASRYCKDRLVLAKVSTESCRTGADGPSHTRKEYPAWFDDREETIGTSVSDYDDAPLCSAGWKYHPRIRQDLDNVMAPVKLRSCRRYL